MPHEPTRDDADHELNNRLFFRLVQAANIYHRQATRELSISAIQGVVLGALSRYRDEGIAFSALVEYLAVSRQNLDAVLKRMERQGLVERIEGPTDRRIRIVRLTSAGAVAWDDLSARTVEFYKLATETIPVDARAAFVEVLVQVSRGLKSIRLDSARKPGPRPKQGRRRPHAGQGATDAPRQARGAEAGD
ncbi:MarR family winged helix-turn-helix transcriptional regulator [Chelatococcus reniformis]|uniref:HTH marR-type domain-containing protein n=1 Tax=Chelatococcus reniformis TaxID=1494448 RepID=A0A916U7H5_9HYPH|nr:MarR family transcriptional regulator [Chelatococcus reniformis]GGC63458.1 hypothetical protein GCM10010994_22590 [Chelatococcus reniformis]